MDFLAMHCEHQVDAMPKSGIENALAQLPGWHIAHDLERTFPMPSYMDGATFVQQIATLAEAEDHHPEITLGYKQVKVALTTHSVGGLSVNDFILAAKVQRLWQAFS